MNNIYDKLVKLNSRRKGIINHLISCKMKMGISFSFFLFLLFIPTVYAVELSINSSHAILYNLDSGNILYEKNSEDIISIASLTKIMTAIVAIENMDSMDTKVTLTNEDFEGLYEANASVANFYPNEVVTYRDLLYGLLFPSGADAAQALTRLIGGREHFLFLMNQKCQELGLKNTHFMNETGLDEENHYSTVKDVATFFLYALENETFREIIMNKKYTTSDGTKTYKSTLTNYQERYSISMDYILGGKTGMTSNAGLCLATFAYHEGVNYLLVTAKASINGPTHVNDAKTIYEYFMNHYQNQVIIKEGETLVELPAFLQKKLKVLSDKTIVKYLSNDFQKEEISLEYEGPNYITPLVLLKSSIGTIKVLYKGEVLDKIYISLPYDYKVIYLCLLGGCFFLLVLFKKRKKTHFQKRKNHV